MPQWLSATCEDVPNAVAALGDAAQHDPFWGVRVESLQALGRIGGAEAEKPVLAAANDPTPWVRDVAVRELGNFKDDASLPAMLSNIAATDPAYRVRTAALGALATIKAPNAFDILSAAAKSDSPDDTTSRGGAPRVRQARRCPRRPPLDGVGQRLANRSETRQAAIGAIAELDKTNKDITHLLISYLSEPYFEARLSAILRSASAATRTPSPRWKKC